MAVQKCVEVGSELLQLIPTDVIPLVDGPANEQAPDRAVLLRVIAKRDTCLAQLSKNLRGIKGGLSRIRSRNQHSCSGISDPRPGPSAPTPKVARVLMQHVWDHTVD